VKLFEISKNVISASGILRLERLLAKKLGTDIYRFGGASGELKTKSGDVGYLYFYKTHAFRLDYDKSEQRVAFIDFWTDGAKAVASMKPNFQLVLPAEVSIFKLMSSVAGFLKHPKAGDITVSADDLKEGVQDTTRYDMSEARRVSPEEFITKAKQFAGKQGKKDMIFSYDDLRDIGKAYDIMIPGGFYEVGVGGKDVQSYDLGRVQQASDGTIIRVLPASESHRFVFQEPTLSKDETEALEGAVDEKISAEELFDDLARLVKIIIKGSRPALIVYGGPGTGKTKTILDTVNAAGLAKGSGFVPVKGKASPLALYTTLFLNRKKLIIFDDTDSVWNNDDSVNILKAALDSSPVRTVDWVSPVTQNVTRMTDEEKAEYEKSIYDQLDDDPSAKVKLPSSFEFEGKVIFISNLTKADLDSAVLNRCLAIDMSLTSKQVFERIELIMDHLSAPNSMDLTKDTKVEVLDFLKQQSASGKMKYVSIRTFVGALGVAASGDPKWRDLLKYMGSD
jgi:hypothetical protein